MMMFKWKTKLLHWNLMGLNKHPSQLARIQLRVCRLAWSVITDRVHSTTGRLCFDSCLSICLSTPGGGYPSQVQAGGVPQPAPAGGYPMPGGTLTRGVPHLRYPPLDLAGVHQWGYPTSGTPCLIWLGGTPTGGAHLRYTPCWTWPGGYPNGGYPTLGIPPIRPGPPQVPPIRPGQGVPQLGGYPTSGTTPHQTWPGGTLTGVPHLRYPHLTWLRVPWQGGTHLRYTPCWIWLGGTPPWVHPPVRPGRGVPQWGVPPTLPSDLGRGVPWQGGTPPR